MRVKEAIRNAIIVAYREDPLESYTEIGRRVIEELGLTVHPRTFRKTVKIVVSQMPPLVGKPPRGERGLKILFMDIENAPHLGYMWSLWDFTTPLNMVRKYGYILSWSAKWMGHGRVMNDSIIKHRKPTAKDGEYTWEDDFEVTASLRRMLDQADIVIGHNMKKFDVKTFNTSAIRHGIMPPSPYQVVDTLTIAKAHFKFPSNRLDELGKILKCGRKVAHAGFTLWLDCMNGVKKAFKKMVKYCDQDVLLVEEVYHKLLPFVTNHPNVAINDYSETGGCMCSKCGSEDITHTTNLKHTKVASYQVFFCNECFSWGAYRTNVNKIKERLTKTA